MYQTYQFCSGWNITSYEGYPEWIINFFSWNLVLLHAELCIFIIITWAFQNFLLKQIFVKPLDWSSYIDSAYLKKHSGIWILPKRPRFLRERPGPSKKWLLSQRLNLFIKTNRHWFGFMNEPPPPPPPFLLSFINFYFIWRLT